MNTYYPFNEDATNSITETLTISGGQIRLRHIPQEGSVTISGFVETNSLTLSGNKFRVDYYDANGNYRDASRRIFFATAQNGTQVTVNYTAVGTPVTAADMNELKAHIENNSIHDSTIRFRGVMDDFPASKRVGDVVFQGSGKSFIWSGAEWLPFKSGSGGSGSGGYIDAQTAEYVARADKIWLPFNKKMRTDVFNYDFFYKNEAILWYGPVGTATGIKNGKAYFYGQDYLKGNRDELQGHPQFDTTNYAGGDFTISLWAQMDSDATRNAALFDLGMHCLLHRNEVSLNQIAIQHYYDFHYYFTTPTPLTERFHVAVVYSRPSIDSSGIMYLFFNGSRLASININLCSGSTSNFLVAASGSVNPGNLWKGYMEHFFLINGVALWTQDFTPPDSRQDYLDIFGTYPD